MTKDQLREMMHLLPSGFKARLQTGPDRRSHVPGRFWDSDTPIYTLVIDVDAKLVLICTKRMALKMETRK